jgi:ribulose-phosphate 3-epimerase
MMDVQLSASILSADFSILGKELLAVEKAGVASIHFDVMDMHYVPNLTFGAVVLKDIANITSLPINVHLMVDHPKQYIEEYVKQGASCLIFHIDTKDNIHELIKLGLDLGVEVGVALNPGQPADLIVPYLDKLNRVLVMTVCPGFAGQEFIAANLAKVKFVKSKIISQKLSCIVEVDGGVKLSNCQEIILAGADSLVMGSGLFANSSYTKVVDEFKRCKKNLC